MAGYIRGTKAWETMIEREFGQNLRNLYAKAPDAKEEIVKIAKRFAEIMDLYMESVNSKEMAFTIIVVDKNDNITEIESR